MFVNLYYIRKDEEKELIVEVSSFSFIIALEKALQSDVHKSMSSWTLVKVAIQE